MMSGWRQGGDEMTATTLRVATVQLESRQGDLAGNLARAAPLVEEAAGRGARLILLPEFLATGYVFSRELWDAAEPRDGPTARWLAEQAGRWGALVGASFLEAEGEDFYNTFVLAGPGGEAGRVRKATPAAFEAYFTRGRPGPHVLDTALGRIGVGICFENQLAATPRRFHAREGAADLVLMPHSAPLPQPWRPIPPAAIEAYRGTLEALPEHYARALGVPVVLSNKVGPWRTPLPGLPFLDQDSRFPGLSAIADSDGRLLARLGEEPGVLVEDVKLDPARWRAEPPACAGFWAMPVPPMVHLFRLFQGLGYIAYQASADRKARARATCGR
jgi:N-carbamoylputrescine amidase